MALEEHLHEFAENHYFVPDDFDNKSGVELIRFGRNLAKPGYRSGPRIIDYYSIHFIRSGSVELKDESMNVTLSAGDLFCLFPHRTYSYRMIGSEVPLEMTWVAFDGALASTLTEMIPICPSAPYARAKMTKEVLLILELLLKTGIEKSRFSKLKRCGLIYRLFGQLAEQPKASDSEGDGSKEWIHDSMEYMKTHFG